MKKLLAAVLAVLCLAGCSGKQEQAPAVEPPAQEPEVIVETVPDVEEVPMDEVTVEEPIEQEPEVPEEEPAEPISIVSRSEDRLEGLVGDTIGYSFDTPVFMGFEAADKVAEFYQNLAEHLESYTKETINEQCLNNGLMASVFGEIGDILLVRDGQALEIHYEFRVEFSDGSQKINSRVDTFDVKTGEVQSVTE